MDTPCGRACQEWPARNYNRNNRYKDCLPTDYSVADPVSCCIMRTILILATASRTMLGPCALGALGCKTAVGRADSTTITTHRGTQMGLSGGSQTAVWGTLLPTAPAGSAQTADITTTRTRSPPWALCTGTLSSMKASPSTTPPSMEWDLETLERSITAPPRRLRRLRPRRRLCPGRRTASVQHATLSASMLMNMVLATAAPIPTAAQTQARTRPAA